MFQGDRFLLTDQVGTLRAVADSTGTIVKRIDYDSFGNTISDSNPSFSVPFGFAGGLHDRDTGLVRFGYRDYSPELGRFVAKDPIDFAGGDTNLYAYSMSDPVNFVDPTGEVPILVPVIIGGIVGTWIWGSDANAPEGPETPLMPPQSGAEAAAAAAAGAGGGILAAEGAAAGVCMVRTVGPFIVKDPPHKGLGPHYHYGPRYPGSNHPRYHVGPRNTGAGNFTWKQWFQNGMPWRWK